jgi:pimeloyl-ACP methyl ester carboxylesterase
VRNVTAEEPRDASRRSFLKYGAGAAVVAAAAAAGYYGIIRMRESDVTVRNEKDDCSEGSVQVGDIEMSYRMCGDGYPLVMIMGYGSTMNLWEPGLVNAIASHFKVIVFDNRGMGNTGDGEREFTIEQFADDTGGLMNALGIQKAHVLGWSMGSLIAQELVLNHPEKVDKLILYAAHCDANMFPPSPEVIEKLRDTSGTPEEQGMRWISLLFPSDWLESHGDRVKEIFFRPMGSTPPESIGKQAMAIGNWDGSCDRLPEIKNQTLLVAGADDILVPPKNSQYMVGRIPRAQLTILEKGGHGIMFQFPDKFAQTVISFLA